MEAPRIKWIFLLLNIFVAATVTVLILAKGSAKPVPETVDQSVMTDAKALNTLRLGLEDVRYNSVCAAWKGNYPNSEMMFFIHLPGAAATDWKVITVGNFGFTGNNTNKFFSYRYTDQDILGKESVSIDTSDLTCMEK